MKTLFAGRKRVLICIFVLLSAADLVLTCWLLRPDSGGVYEANPLARRVVEGAGWLGLTGFKVLMVLFALSLIGIVARYRPWLARSVLQGGCALMGVLVLYSGVLVAGERPRRQEQEQAMSKLNSRGQQLDGEIARKRHFLERFAELGSAVSRRSMSLEDAIADLEQHAMTRDPTWQAMMQEAYPGMSRREVLEMRLLLEVEYARELPSLPGSAGVLQRS
jgi:hypothetical protein